MDVRDDYQQDKRHESRGGSSDGNPSHLAQLYERVGCRRWEERARKGLLHAACLNVT